MLRKKAASSAMRSRLTSRDGSKQAAIIQPMMPRKKLHQNPALPRPLPLAISQPMKPLIRSEEHTSELQSRFDLVCRLLLEKKNVLLSVHPKGPACHTGEQSCFFNLVDTKKETKQDVIHRIADDIENRRNHPTAGADQRHLI